MEACLDGSTDVEMCQDGQFNHSEVRFEVTQLGAGILRSSLSPEEGLLVYVDLQLA